MMTLRNALATTHPYDNVCIRLSLMSGFTVFEGSVIDLEKPVKKSRIKDLLDVEVDTMRTEGNTFYIYVRK